MSTISINDLPSDALSHIMEFLQLKEQAIASKVSKTFKTAVDLTHVQETTGYLQTSKGNSHRVFSILGGIQHQELQVIDVASTAAIIRGTASLILDLINQQITLQFKEEKLSIEEEHLCKNLLATLTNTSIRNYYISADRLCDVLSLVNILSKGDRCNTIKDVIENGYLETLQKLLASIATSESDKRKALEAVAGQGYLEILQALLKSGPIPDGATYWALRSAAEQGHLDIVHALLKDEPIPYGAHDARGGAVVSAAGQGHLEIVQALLINGPISDVERGSALLSAAERGHLEIVQALLENGPIPSEAKNRALTTATDEGHLKIVLTLLASGDISGYFRNMALVSAAGKGHLEIVRALLQNRALQDSASDGSLASGIRRALKAAAGNGHQEITAFLQSVVKSF